AVTESVPETDLLEPEEFEGHYDPHLWFDPRLWSQCIDTVVEGLSSVDPANSKDYEKRGKALKARYDALHQWASEYVSQVPQSQRYLITSHDAYNYFGEAFGFKVIGVQGISTVGEAGLADVVKITNFIKEKEIKAIFVESSVSPAMIERVSKGSGAKIGGELFSDAMGEPGQIETATDGTQYDVGTYEGMLKHNVTTIIDALK
ncbi:MAG: zinc ABC transporter substrate-binding protein, partial [Verrucomicrobiota bacterium]